MRRLLYKLLFISLLLILFSCYSDTENNIQKTNKIFENGKHIKVEKTNIITKHIGVFTKNHYGTTHQFSYQFTVDSKKGKINWKDKGHAEPKHLIFCKDSVYVKYLGKKHIPIEKKATDTTNVIKYKDVVKELFEVHIDERYFFRLFGDAYWVEISAEKYNNKKEICAEYNIPNDNELLLEIEVIVDDVKEELVEIK